MTQMGAAGGIQGNDPESKNLQKQIAEKQKQLQELSSNEDLTMEQKMKKRQEIQKEITDLNNQLRQHQIQQRKEKMQEKDTAMDDMLGENKKTEQTEGSQQNSGLSKNSMKAMITADTARDQAQVKGSVASDLEGRAGVLESEIKLDASRGQNVEKKQEELSEVEKKAQDVTASQISSLAEAGEAIKEAGKESDGTEESAGEEEKDKTEKNHSPSALQEEVLPEQYVPIDVRL